MEEGTILKRRTVITTENGEQSKESTGADSEKCNTEAIRDTQNEDEELEDEKKQSEQWMKYKALSFKQKYRMEKSAKVPSVREYSSTFISFNIFQTITGCHHLSRRQAQDYSNLIQQVLLQNRVI